MKNKGDTICDKCGKLFYIKNIKVRTKIHRKKRFEIEERYFSCPHCHAMYKIGVSDLKLEVLQKKVKEQQKNTNLDYLNGNKLKYAISTFKHMNLNKRVVKRIKYLKDLINY